MSPLRGWASDGVTLALSVPGVPQAMMRPAMVQTFDATFADGIAVYASPRGTVTCLMKVRGDGLARNMMDASIQPVDWL